MENKNMREEESEEFLEKMMESNRERIDYEIDDDLFDMCIFDRDGNLIGFNWETPPFWGRRGECRGGGSTFPPSPSMPPSMFSSSSSSSSSSSMSPRSTRSLTLDCISSSDPSPKNSWPISNRFSHRSPTWTPAGFVILESTSA